MRQSAKVLRGLSRLAWQQASSSGNGTTASRLLSAPCRQIASNVASTSGRSFGIAEAVTFPWASSFLLRGRGHQQLGVVKQVLEQRLTAFAVALFDTRAGQRLLSTVLPSAMLCMLFPQSFHCVALDVQHKYCKQLLPPQPQPLLKLHLPIIVQAFLEEIQVMLRGLYLAILFAPMVLTAPLVFSFGLGGAEGRAAWMDLLRNTMAAAGPAWIKWSQWAATRPDMFPQDFCRSLEKLQTQAPSHDAQHTKLAVEEAFARPLNYFFEAFEETPVASGSIAQIHRARLGAVGAAATGYKRGTTVAVKVRHPGVSILMERDFKLMVRAAHLAAMLPGLSNLRLEESIRQFGGPLKEQLDLAMEAQNLERFTHNFRSWNNVTFPRPLYPLVSSDVLVETFEEGDLISGIVDQADGYKHRYVLAQTGLNLYLQMLFKDNFMHADMHPGNILVKEVDYRSFRGLTRMITSMFEFRPQLVLLDVGMIAELRPEDQHDLVDFFSSLTRQDGERLARSILRLSEQHTCKDPEAFVCDMRHMFDKLDPVTIRENTSDVFKDMIETLRLHNVTLQNTVSTVVVTALVLEGWSHKLDPNLHILDTMRDMLVTDWSERIGCVVDRIMTTGGIAVV